MVWSSRTNDITNAKTGCITHVKPNTTTNQLIYFGDVISPPSAFFLPASLTSARFSSRTVPSWERAVILLPRSSCVFSVSVDWKCNALDKIGNKRNKMMAQKWFHNVQLITVYERKEKELTTVTNSVEVTLNFNIPRGEVTTSWC